MVPFVGDTVKLTPLQEVVLIAVIAGFGLTVAVSVNTLPIQFPEVGVTK